MNLGLSFEELQKDKQLQTDFIDFFFGYNLYQYQQNFMFNCFNYNRIAAKFPRQSGKSQCVAIYVTFISIIQKKDVIIVSPTQNQSNEIFLKIKTLMNNNQLIYIYPSFLSIYSLKG